MVDSMENYKFDLGVKGLMTPSIKEFLNFFFHSLYSHSLNV